MVSIPSNFLNNDYQRESRVVSTFSPNKNFFQLLQINLSPLVALKHLELRSYEIPSICPFLYLFVHFFHFSRVFLQNYPWQFSDFLYEVRMPSNLKSDRAGFFGKKSCSGLFWPKCTGMDPEWSFSSFMKNWHVEFIRFFDFWSYSNIES